LKKPGLHSQASEEQAAGDLGHFCFRGKPVNPIVKQTKIQWIGLKENLQENPIFNGKISCRFSIKPIH
jgi:hypothetical protein